MIHSKVFFKKFALFALILAAECFWGTHPLLPYNISRETSLEEISFQGTLNYYPKIQKSFSTYSLSFTRS